VLPDPWTIFALVAVSLFSALTAILVFGQVLRSRALIDRAPNFLRDGKSTAKGDQSFPQARPGQPDGKCQQILDKSPMLIWRQDRDKVIVWANRTYQDLAARVHPGVDGATRGHAAIFAEAGGQQSGRRRALKLTDQANPLWLEQTSHAQQDGETLHFAVFADPVVKAEEALRNFIQTLTKTFAHLPIGLAIFDRDRQLALFNPALADLTTLDPAWLTARPTLRDFLDCLREYRHIPEPKDYRSWRDRIAALEKAAQDGTYEENWPLPTGQTYRVTGRPHPEGAVAFLFEDITTTISLQRHFRAELELGQSVLDNMADGIAVFAANADLVLSNNQFARIWSIDPREMLARLSMKEAVTQWGKACEPNTVWRELLDFATRARPVIETEARIRLKTGESYQIQVQPLPQGAVLCRFAPPGALVGLVPA